MTPSMMPIWLTQDVYLWGEMRRVAMLLMAEDPKKAAFFGQGLRPVDEVIRRGNGVVRLERSGRLDAYLIVRDGTRYVSPRKPEGIADSEVVVVEISGEPQKVLLRRLRRLSRAILRVSPEMYERSAVGLVTRVEAYDREDEQTSELLEQVVGRIVDGVLSAHAKNSTLAIPIIEWSLECCNRVVREFNTFNIKGDVAKVAVAALMFFKLHPSPEMLVSKTGMASLVGAVGSRIGPVVPPLRVGFYLTTSDSFIAARGAARFLRQQGKDSCRAAVSTVSVVQFYEYLNQALLMYLAAQEIYRELLKLGEQVPEIWREFGLDKEEIRRYWVETEEARVAILSSFSQVAMPWMRGPNPARPARLFNYVVGFLEENGFERCEMMVYDLTVRLICPEFLRDLTLALLALAPAFSGPVDRWRRRVTEIIADLERDLINWVIRGEPNYLHYAYEIGAGLERKKGAEREARILEQRRDQLSLRVDELLATYE